MYFFLPIFIFNKYLVLFQLALIFVKPKEIFDQYLLIFAIASLQLSGYITVNEN